MLRNVRMRRRRDDSGASAVEFALVLPILLILVFGIIQYGWYFYAMQAGTSATSDVARRMSVGDCQTTASRDALLAQRLGTARANSTSITATPTYKSAAGAPATTPEVGGTLALQVEFQTFDFNFPLIPVPDNGKVTRTVTVRVEDTTASAGGCS